MGSNRTVHGRRKKFNKAGGRHSKRTKMMQSKRMRQVEMKYKNVKSASFKVKSQSGLKLKMSKMLVKKALRCVKDKNSNKLYIKTAVNKVDGNRIFNMNILKSTMQEVTKHTILCGLAVECAKRDEPVIAFESIRDKGFYFMLSIKCCGCGTIFQVENSERFSENCEIKDINVKSVWGSMVTGGGCSSLNEMMGTLGVPGIDEKQYSHIENEIGKLWKDVLEEEMLDAGKEEKRLAEENDDSFEGIPAISVICDGGWSKRSHKHTYNAMAGVGVIFGARTKKLLHIGIRNKLCYICSRANTKNINPQPHECFKNWDLSSQSMETDIILDGFLQCEQKYGLRYMRMICDGDSSVYSSIIKNVPVWGSHVEKIECANHATKCIRSNLEKLINIKPQYKGKGKLSKSNIQKITSGVRCAVIMRSKEEDRKAAIMKLKKDIRNCARHVLGYHDMCSTDFCIHSKDKSIDQNDDDEENEMNETESDVIVNICDYWNDTTKTLSKDEIDRIRNGGTQQMNSDNTMETLLKDVYIILNRMSEKAHRLIGNFTSNLAESWMHIKCKFDGGKMFNKCFRGSFYARCYGGALRSMFGPAWAPQVYQRITKKIPDNIFIQTYRKRVKKYLHSKHSHNKSENILKRKKRKFKSTMETSTKRARLDYGENVLEDTEDISIKELQEECDIYMKENIDKCDINQIERNTRGQSDNTAWYEERTKRITSSNFGEIINRSIKNNSNKIIKRFLYSKFKGTLYTIRGLAEEENARTEYLNLKTSENIDKIIVPGLRVCEEFKYLAASSDGLVMFQNKAIGLIEIKTLLQNKKTLIRTAAKTDKSFCLTYNDEQISLKKGHKYFYQIQGQLNIWKLDWCDLIIRRNNPNDIYIERIHRDSDLWNRTMVPKLSAFYKTHILPELASPRVSTITGIRQPLVPWFKEDRSNKPGRATRKSNITEKQTPQPSSSSSTHRPQQQSSSELPKARVIVAELAPQPSTSSSTQQQSLRRERKTKFVGRRISQQWTEDDGSTKWYNGTVLSVINGKDGDPKAIYQVQYDNEQDSYDVDSLTADYKEGTLKFIDL